MVLGSIEALGGVTYKSKILLLCFKIMHSSGIGCCEDERTFMWSLAESCEFMEVTLFSVFSSAHCNCITFQDRISWASDRIRNVLSHAYLCIPGFQSFYFFVLSHLYLLH